MLPNSRNYPGKDRQELNDTSWVSATPLAPPLIRRVEPVYCPKLRICLEEIGFGLRALRPGCNTLADQVADLAVHRHKDVIQRRWLHVLVLTP